MTIDQIDEWFQLAARAMFASVALGEYTFYLCKEGPGCEWPPREPIVPESVAMSWDLPKDCGTIHCGSPEEAEALIALAGAEALGGVH